jgi:hypothetical protein
MEKLFPMKPEVPVIRILAIIVIDLIPDVQVLLNYMIKKIWKDNQETHYRRIKGIAAAEEGKEKSNKEADEHYGIFIKITYIIS